MKLVNGIDKPVTFSAAAIKKEASFDDGLTSIVFYKTNDKEISISQHECGDWDISVDGEPHQEFDEQYGDNAVRNFLQLVRS